MYGAMPTMSSSIASLRLKAKQATAANFGGGDAVSSSYDAASVASASVDAAKDPTSGGDAATGEPSGISGEETEAASGMGPCIYGSTGTEQTRTPATLVQ